MVSQRTSALSVEARETPVRGSIVRRGVVRDTQAPGGCRTVVGGHPWVPEESKWGLLRCAAGNAPLAATGFFEQVSVVHNSLILCNMKRAQHWRWNY